MNINLELIKARAGREAVAGVAVSKLDEAIKHLREATTMKNKGLSFREQAKGHLKKVDEILVDVRALADELDNLDRTIPN